MTKRSRRSSEKGIARRIPDFIGWPLYEGVIAAELGLHRAWERGAGRVDPAPLGVLDDITALVKTFERPRQLRRLMSSIRRHYPDLKVVIADDSRDVVDHPDAEVVHLPFRSGVSAGRSAALARATTEFILLLDDDYVLTSRTGLAGALARMRDNPTIDIMGGRVINLPLGQSSDYVKPGLFKKTPRPEGEIDGLPTRRIVANFYIARTERLRLVDWDPEIRVMDHTDFFTRAFGTLTTVENEELVCLHANTPFSRRYMRFRSDKEADIAVLRARWRDGPKGT